MDDLLQAATLRRVLVGHYDELKRKLARRLGSEDLASEALHETYLHLERSTRLDAIASPRQYLLTIATNLARMSFRRDKWRTQHVGLDEALDFADESADPLSTLIGRQEIEALQRAFDELTPRRRQILFSIRVEGAMIADVAKKLGVSQRTVEQELRSALITCGSILGRAVVQRFGPKPRKASQEERAAAAAPVEE